MVAGEARQPRKVMKRAFKMTIYRLMFFFFGSALAIGESTGPAPCKHLADSVYAS